MDGQEAKAKDLTRPTGFIDKTLLDACIHCGLCLPACPTYLATGREVESPRGRIYLLNLLNSGEQELSPRLAEHIDSCLGCLGCQTACPSGVKYEAILNQARPQLAQARPGFRRRLMRFVFERVLPNYEILENLGKLLRLWQKVRARLALDLLGRGPLRPLFGKLAEVESFLPQIPTHVPLPKQSWNVGKKEGSVEFFCGCVMDVFYGPVNHAALRLLRAQGQIVKVPEQTCCGALAFHAGEVDITLCLAKRNIEAFEHEQGPIVVTSAGCGAMLKEYELLFKNDEDWLERAKVFASRVQDISEFLASHQLPEHVRSRAQAVAPKVAYHAACHLAHAQNVRQAPLKLLEMLASDIQERAMRERTPALELVPLVDAEHCCGSAGIFNLLHPELSGQVLAAKMARLQESGADLVVTANPGCLMQLETGVRRTSSEMRVLHLAELLDQSYALQDQDN